MKKINKSLSFVQQSADSAINWLREKYKARFHVNISDQYFNF